MASEFKYIFTEKAVDDLDKTLDYISNKLNNSAAAKRLLDNISDAITEICSFPELGALVQNEYLTRKDVRCIVIDNYIMYYIPEIEKKEILIVSIVYGKRNLNSIMSEFNKIWLYASVCYIITN